MLPNRTLMALKKETHLIRVSNCWCRCGTECNICKLTICKTQPNKKVTRKRKEKDKCVEKITWKFNGSTTMAEEFGKDPSWILGGNCRHSRAFITPSTPSCLCCPQCSRYPLRFVRYRTNHLPRWFGGYIYIYFFCMCVHYPRTFNCRPARFPFSLIPHSNASRGGWGDGGGEGQSLLPTPPPTFHSLYTMAGSANQLSLPGRH